MDYSVKLKDLLSKLPRDRLTRCTYILIEDYFRFRFFHRYRSSTIKQVKLWKQGKIPHTHAAYLKLDEYITHIPFIWIYTDATGYYFLYDWSAKTHYTKLLNTLTEVEKAMYEL